MAIFKNRMDEFRHDVAKLVNKHGLEERFGFTDFALAGFICDSIEALNRAKVSQVNWLKAKEELSKPIGS